MTDTARVILWGRDIGAVTWLPERGLGVFQYTPEFARSGIEVAPMMMPLSEIPYEFPSLSRETFATVGGIKRTRAKAMLAEVASAVSDWPNHAGAADMAESEIKRIARAHRRELFT